MLAGKAAFATPMETVTQEALGRSQGLAFFKNIPPGGPMVGGLWTTFAKYWPEERELSQIQMRVPFECPSGFQPNRNDVLGF